MVPIWLALVLACAPQDPAQAAAATAPPPVLMSLSIHQPYGLAGAPLYLSVRDAPANTTLTVALSTSQGPPWACPPALAPECLSLGAPARPITRLRTDRSGSGSVEIVVPDPVPAPWVEFQVAGARGGARALSSTVARYLLDRTGDEDGDGLTNAEEQGYFGARKADSDLDGINDYDEVRVYGTDPDYISSDGDSLPDGDELLIYNTDPLHHDTDRDGLRDDEEVRWYSTDPLRVDTDGGGLTDGQEVDAGLDPLDPTDG